MPEYKIVRISEEPTLEDGRAGALIHIEFTVGPDGPFHERFPKEGLTDFTVTQKLDEFARLVQRTRG